MSPQKCFSLTILLIIIFNWVALKADAQLEFEAIPIRYSESEPQDPIARLQQQINRGDVNLIYEGRQGYLKSLLKELEIPRSTQTLVFSKTSLQLRRISPRRPRALYFNDNVYVGWVQDGDVIEISSVDPHLGAVFYTLSMEEVDRPQFLRDKGQCLTCHASSRTEGVPGHVMRSVFADRTGQPQFGSGTYSTKQSSPFDKRWGGWYVTGTHGEMRHMGNVIAAERQRPEDLDRETGANVTDLSAFVSTSPYLESTSDLVALMVLGHQLELHNLITRGNFETRSAVHYNGVMNKALERDPDFISESTERRVASVGEKILRCLLFADEFQLTSSVKGNSTFQEEFERQGIRDRHGRSLRDFDLETRLFKYPCSYLIYSDAFDALPQLVKDYVTRRLLEVLNNSDENLDFANLTKTDRQNILDILKETKPSLFSDRERSQTAN